MQVLLLRTIYKAPYDDHSDEKVVGVYSSQEMVDKAIAAYKKRLHSISCEVLLDDTQFVTNTIELDYIKT